MNLQIASQFFGISNQILLFLMEVPRYLYTLFISLDANFQMKCKNVSSDKADPGLSKEWAYFIEETAYKAHIQEYANKTEPVGQDP